MSSPPASPAALPTTPTKESITAVNKENTTPRTPLPDGPVNGAGKIIAPVEVDAPKNPGEVVQVPSTAPPPEVSIGKPDEAQKNGQVEDEHANDAEEATSDSETMGSEGTIADLPPFDWAQLQRRYTNAIQGVNKQEDEILEEFFKYSDVSSLQNLIWNLVVLC
jgi:hypothetical protein